MSDLAGITGSGVAGPPISQAPAPVQTAYETNIQDPNQFAIALLTFMGLPQTADNVTFLVSWAAAEGGQWENTAHFNPLNTTLQMPGSSIMGGGNTAGVQSYTSWQQGLQATADTLRGYPAIMGALQHGNAMQANNSGQLGGDFSKWSGGGYTHIGSSAGYGTTKGGPAGGPVGGAPSAGTAATAPAQTTIGQVGLATAQQNYPELAWMLQIPDAAADIQTWAAQDYTPDEIAARLEGKAWYQRLGATFFTWIGQQATNPTQAAQTYQEQLAAVKQTFAQLGLKPSAQQLQTFAYQALAQDWTTHPELEQQAIAGTIAVNPDGTFSVRNYSMVGGQMTSTFIGPGGNTASTNWKDYQTTLPASYVTSGLVSQIGTVAAGGKPKTEGITSGAPVYAMIGGQLQQGFNIKTLAPGTPLYTLPNFVTGPAGQPAAGPESTMAGSLQNAQQVFETTAGQYMVPISKQGTAALVQQAIAGGTTDVSTMAKTYFQAQAKSLYPTMAVAIDAGITPQAYTDPYRQVVSNLLGVSPDAVDMMDPKYLRFVTQKDPKTGVPTAMSLYDAQQLVMSDPVYGYMKSQNAMDRASAIAQGLGEMFGRTPTVPSGFSGAQAPAV